MLTKLFNEYDRFVSFENIINSTENEYINKYPIYVINLKKDVTRRKYIKYLFKKHKINYVLVTVESFKYKSYYEHLIYVMKPARMGCILSHLWCINNAVKNNYERFIIFEDDIIFHKNFNEMFVNVTDEKNNDIDLLMLGAVDFLINKHICSLNENIYYPNVNVLGAHANLYKHDFAKAFLKYKLTTPKPLEFDYDYARFYKDYKVGVCSPNLVICELSTTNIDHHFSPIEVGFDRYKRSFLEDFTYNDYEYITIVFIDFINENKDNIKTIDEAYQLYMNNNIEKPNIEQILEWLKNGKYTLEDILEIIRD
jgi:GR25 family glycosyltransferase involved in LPS biosynthesis